MPPSPTTLFVEGTTCHEQSAATGNCTSPSSTTSVANAGFASATRASLAGSSSLIGLVTESLLEEATSAADLEPGADER